MSTRIEWTDETWSPVTGCTPVSAGCKNCYAETLAHRFWAHQYPLIRDGDDSSETRPRAFGDVQCHAERLGIPIRWRKPRKIFVCSMSDLFHEAVPAEFIRSVFNRMALAHRHTFQVLTKRSDRMRDLLNRWETMYGPATNVHVGVTIENVDTRWRLGDLIETPAVRRFLSLEPLLGPLPGLDLKSIHHVIVGGESGPGARPCDVEWIRSVVQQCKAAGVACFVKQLGAKPRGWCASLLQRGALGGGADFCDSYESGEAGHCGDRCQLLKNRKGANPAEWPEDLRVREEMPA